MSTISLKEAQASLASLVARLHPGEEIIITEGDQPVARIVGEAGPRRSRQLGTLKGSIAFMSPDFDAPLEDFKEYME